LGFTTHDSDLMVDGISLKASPGMQPTTIVQSTGIDVDGLEVSGAITADVIRADDLAAGRWDGAYLEIFLFDWTDPALGIQLLAAGELGAVSFTDDSFDAELLGLQSTLQQPVAPQTSPACRAAFCDRDCGLSRERFRHIATVTQVDGHVLFFSPQMSFTPGAFAQGEMRWLSGRACGLNAYIAANDESSMTLHTVPEQGVGPGDVVELIEGCDKLIETCATRFGNAVNFRGEPYLPGNDLLTRYPGGG
jgi:uncharacterized phage protein (TIGR02218 family)